MLFVSTKNNYRRYLEVKILANQNIGCTVSECKHHAKSANLCNLQHIQIGRCGANAQAKEFTECASFEYGS